MTSTVYRLAPRWGGGFHLGRQGLEQEDSAESFPSDSLFAALIATLAEIEGPGAVDEFMNGWPQLGHEVEPPFRLSSLFPYAGDLLLFPMPRLRAEVGDIPQRGLSKALKKLEYVSATILGMLLAGKPVADWLPHGDPASSKGVLLQGGKVWIGRDEMKLLPPDWQKYDLPMLREEARIWKAGPVPRVTLDRISNSSQIYQVGRTVFAEGCGLWFLAEFYDERLRARLENLLDHLADRGIGGERSAGYGGFAVSTGVKVPSLPTSMKTARVMTLSRYSPTLNEREAGVLAEGASYELVTVGGWLASPGGPAQRRKRVRLIEAGSVLRAPNDGSALTGQVLDVRPEYDQPGAPQHPVYRSGIALTVGVSGGE